MRIKVAADTASANEWAHVIVTAAIEKNASDVHFEPIQQSMRVRLRVDGILYEVLQLPKKIGVAIVSHLKIKANLNIAEKRLPQDGRYHVTGPQQKTYDCRISTLPTLHGEKLVLRLLCGETRQLQLHHLGLTATQQHTLANHIQKPQGLILITGATGSGKTTTLYTALNQLDTTQKNISTLEDPIEIELEHINQTNVNPNIGLDFERALRALLRQDPDVIMVGEIRDKETANMAIHAAQTGHLVLTTLHTNTAVESLTRLSMMGILAIDLAETLSLIVAQRLVRKLCPHCKILDGAHARADLGGCAACTFGFHGRTGVYQFFELNHTSKEQLLQGSPPSVLAKTAHLTSLWEEGLSKVYEGLTTLEELQRTIRRDE